MIELQSFSDKAAISLSALCTFHCLALPFFLVMFPSVASLQLDNEAFHFWMILFVIPISVYALTLGCKKHKRLHLLTVGATGLAFLVLALMLPESILGEAGEKTLTLIGATFIAFGHIKNYHLCKTSQNCGCPEHQLKN